MTNAEKYLKEGVDLCELIRNIADYKPKLETSDNVYAKMQEFFYEPTTLTLTEDERVILRNININEYNYIARNEQGNLFLEYKSQQARGLTCTSYLILGQMFWTNLFQFIKERRRISN